MASRHLTMKHTINTAMQPYVNSEFARANSCSISEEKVESKAICAFGKLGIIFLVLVLIALATGTYFAIEWQGMSYATNETVTAPAIPTTPRLPTYSNKSKLYQNQTGQVSDFADTDPGCRKPKRALSFLFACFTLRDFEGLPENNTIRCKYLERVGKCIRKRVERRYRIKCNKLDELSVLKNKAKSIKKSLRFDIFTACPKWWLLYNRAFNKAATSNG